MKQCDSVEGRLFYTVYQMSKKSLINNFQKGRLKGNTLLHPRHDHPQGANHLRVVRIVQGR
jgi:hypothetical protein